MRVKILTYLFLVLVLSMSVQAFGVGTPYMEDKTLKLYPGQNYLFKVELQNKDGEDVMVRVELESAIATLIGGPDVKIPAMSYEEAFVYFNITAPKQSLPGDSYTINYVVTPTAEGEGQIPLQVRYDRSFRVLVVDKPVGVVDEQQPTELFPEQEPKPAKTQWIFLPLVMIVIAVLAILLWNKSHQMSGKIMGKGQGKTLGSWKPQHEASHPTAQHAKHPAIKPQPEPVTQAKQEPIIQPRTAIQAPSQPKPNVQKATPKQEGAISSHNYFHLRSGRSLKTLPELYTAIKTMSHDEFSHHVNDNKNDFANWAEHVLEKPSLASQLTRTTSKQETLEMIKNELDQR